jgi:hypothetical protein
MRYLFLFIPILLSSFPAQAMSLVSTNAYRLPADEVVEHELWLNAQEITVDGIVSNDFFFLGNDITINGQMHDEVWGLSNNSFYLNGECKDDLRVFAKKSLVINGPVQDDIMAMADTILIDTNAIISGSITLKGRTIVIKGQIKGEVRASANEALTLHTEIGKNAVLDAPEILLIPGTRIEGDLIYSSGAELAPVDGVHIGGQVKKTKQVDPIYEGTLRKMAFLVKVLVFGTTFFAGIVFLRVFPAFSQAGPIIIRSYRGPSMLSGGLSLIFITASIFLAMASVVGIPFSLLLAAILMLLITFGKVLVGYTIGLAVMRLQNQEIVPFLSQISALFLGTGIIFLASTVPLMIGPAISMIVNFLGAGTLLIMIKQSQTGSGVLIPTAPSVSGTGD